MSCTSFSAFALVIASLQGCCTFVGGGIGSLIPGPYEELPPTQVVLERDERVLVLLRNGGRVSGYYRGTHGPTPTDLERYLLVSADENLVAVRLSDVSSIAVEVTGKGWLYGGLIGLAADATLVVIAVIAVNNMQFRVFDERTRF
jgi:hypothetical protein